MPRPERPDSWLLFMTNERFNELMRNEDLSLTPEEIAQDWHFCYEFDGLLRKPRDDDDPRSFECNCLTTTSQKGGG